MCLDSQAYTTVIRVTFGLNGMSDDDAILSLFEETIQRMTVEGVPGACLVDFFPIRKLFILNREE